MKALQYIGKETLQIVDVPTPHIQPNEILLKMKKVGICGTDLHIYHGGMPDLPTPLIIGHEFVGDIVEVGSDVTNVKVGDRAVAEHVVGCGHCKYCLEGHKNICLTPTVLGLHRSGALAEYMAIPADLVYAVPPEISYDDAVLIEPLSIAVYAIRLSEVTVGDTVAVVGQGPIGLFVDQIAQAAGATVIGIDILPARLEYAKNNHVVNEIINSKEQNPMEAIKNITEMDGADIVFEVVGREQTAELSIEVARRGGKVIVLGVFEHNVSLNMMHVVKKELDVKGSWTCLNSFKPTINLLKTGKIKTQGLITHRYPFEQAIKAFEESSSYSENRIKSVIEFS